MPDDAAGPPPRPHARRERARSAMIRVTVELLPGGDASRARHLGTAEIANDGTGTAEAGNYVVTLSKWGRPKQAWKRGAFSGFDRKRLGPWDLLLCALISCGIGDRLTKPSRTR